MSTEERRDKFLNEMEALCEKHQIAVGLFVGALENEGSYSTMSSSFGDWKQIEVLNVAGVLLLDSPHIKLAMQVARVVRSQARSKKVKKKTTRKRN